MCKHIPLTTAHYTMYFCYCTYFSIYFYAKSLYFLTVFCFLYIFCTKRLSQFSVFFSTVSDLHLASTVFLFTSIRKSPAPPHSLSCPPPSHTVSSLPFSDPDPAPSFLICIFCTAVPLPHPTLFHFSDIHSNSPIFLHKTSATLQTPYSSPSFPLSAYPKLSYFYCFSAFLPDFLSSLPFLPSPTVFSQRFLFHKTQKLRQLSPVLRFPKTTKKLPR